MEQFILRAIKELTQENISYTSDTDKNYDFNTADTLNTLLLNCMFASGQLKEGEMYDVDFDHQFIETEKNPSWQRTLCSFFLQHLSVTSTRPLSKDLTQRGSDSMQQVA